VGNDEVNLSLMSLNFDYFPYCEKNPPCGGPARGVCEQPSDGRHPFCVCKTAGFDNKTYCFECLAGHFGPVCAVCRDCYNGTCRDGYTRDGGCTCYWDYTGSNCLVHWIIYAFPSIGGVLLIGIIAIFIRKCICKAKQKGEKAPLNRN